MYDLLFSPGKIGGLTLPNRIAMTAASASLSQPDGTMTEDMLAYYEARAKGGVGLIITEMVCVDEDGGFSSPGNSTPPGRRTSPPSAAWRTGSTPTGPRSSPSSSTPGPTQTPS